MPAPRLLPLALAALVAASSARAQRPAPRDLSLSALFAAAERHDPRASQRPLADSAARLRLRTVDAERLPTLQMQAQAQYVSDVPTINGVPMVPYQQYDAYLVVRQRLWDPTRAPRRELESAQREETDARLRASLWQQRQLVSDAFFTTLALDGELRTIEAAQTAIATQRRLAEMRRDAGVSLAGEVALLEAEELRLAQRRDAVRSDRTATQAVLGSLTGVALGDADTLRAPELARRVAETLAAEDSLRERPEYAQYAAARATLAERARASSRQEMPRLSAFARSGYGRPGINPLARDFQQYWIAGLQFEWTPWTWGSGSREAEVQLLQREILQRDEAAFTERLQRAIMRDRESAARLDRSLASDARIIALHEQVLAETTRRYGEGTATAAELVDRQTDLVTAQIAETRHRVQLAEVRARILITLGQELP